MYFCVYKTYVYTVVVVMIFCPFIYMHYLLNFMNVSIYNIYTHLLKNIYILKYICMCMSVCKIYMRVDLFYFILFPQFIFL